MTDIADDDRAGNGGRHTPGPWCINYNHRHSLDQCDITIAGDVFLLADINGPNYAHCEANARLIAAAPDLLAAVVAALPIVEAALFDAAKTDCMREAELMVVAGEMRNAIAKARGHD